MTVPALSPGKVPTRLVALVGNGTVREVLPVIAVARACPNSVPLRVKLTMGRPKPVLANPDPAIVKLAGGVTRLTEFGEIELTLGAVVVLPANVAVMVMLALTFRIHAAVPLQLPPLQPVNVEPDAGVAVSVTLVPGVYASEQSEEQLMPAGLLVTVPLPTRLTVSVTGGLVVVANVAVIEVFAVILRMQLPVPLQPPPLHPENVEPEDGVADKVMIVPVAYVSEQSEAQLIPAGLLVTVPLPARVTFRVAVPMGVVPQTSPV